MRQEEVASNGRSIDFQIPQARNDRSSPSLIKLSMHPFSSSNYLNSIRNSLFFPFIEPTAVKHKTPPTASSCRFRSLSLNVLLIASFVFVSLICVPSAQACDIWKASDCIGSTTTAEEELMKSDDYTKEQLYKYCDKGKAYVDCVNAKLKCCDLKPELRGALAAYDKQLEKQAWKLGPYCAGLGESNVVKYKCRTTTRATTSTSTKSTKSTMPPCQVEKAGEECSHYLDGRVKFEESWNVYDKMQWCRDTIDYVTCANQFLLNCNISTLKNEADQLQSFIDYVTKSANVHCPGGISGCENNTNDVRCRLGIRYFIGEYNTNSAERRFKSSSKQLASFLAAVFFARTIL